MKALGFIIGTTLIFSGCKQVVSTETGYTRTASSDAQGASGPVVGTEMTLDLRIRSSTVNM